jgi:hypothetical protein
MNLGHFFHEKSFVYNDDFFGVKFCNLATKKKGIATITKAFWQNIGPLLPHDEKKTFEVAIFRQ